MSAQPSRLTAIGKRSLDPNRRNKIGQRGQALSHSPLSPLQLQQKPKRVKYVAVTQLLQPMTPHVEVNQATQ